ncbi:MAG: hypothetical protein M1816_003310 [Peltula sp. TS41687]|nr:MAG: hypothetical protein M1816_003310 [Peltula sp. TS41687]
MSEATVLTVIPNQSLRPKALKALKGKRLKENEGDETETPESKRVAPPSAAARLNAAALRKLQRALEKDPEVDLTTALPFDYAQRLADKKSAAGEQDLVAAHLVAHGLTGAAKASEAPPAPAPAPVLELEGHSPIPLPTDPAIIVHPLSDTVTSILGLSHQKANSNGPGYELTRALTELLQQSKSIWQSKALTHHYVADCSSSIAVKSFMAIPGSSDFTEYTTLEYLEHHKPYLPVPRPHGLITSGHWCYLFMTLMPGTPLREVWPQLSESEKEAISQELDALFLDLRQLRLPEGMALGGVAGEGCKDTRRHTRVSRAPLFTGKELWDFQYGSTDYGSEVYLRFLRQLTSPFQASKCVFTHGDVHTGNIMVDLRSDGRYRVTGLIDWEMSGFYPEDYECTKATNNLGPNAKDDWYLFLPSCISPGKYPLKWLSDRLWDKHVVGCQ